MLHISTRNALKKLQSLPGSPTSCTNIQSVETDIFHGERWAVEEHKKNRFTFVVLSIQRLGQTISFKRKWHAGYGDTSGISGFDKNSLELLASCQRFTGIVLS